MPWQSLGSCGARTDLPWIGEPEEVGPWDAESMRSVCRACPVLAECAAYVDDANVCAGWWAGTHRDPAYVAPVRPGWVRAPGASEAAPAWQGVLPLGGVA
ncbi:WhiB family transcriptional regulator [Terrabacter sp. GCM10028922]|uniref:WhiB family transcriptional regulator n=1 Tax=Terrabacter sp. GCM10028922 TaxID=3273428 RepID=UPI003609DDA3